MGRRLLRRRHGEDFRVTTLGDELPRQMARVRDKVMPAYDDLPANAGAFALALMRRDLDAAAAALASGDVVEQIRPCQALRDYKL